MSKNKGGADGFNNRAAKKFRQPDKVDLMSQQEIFDIFDEDIGTILGQYTAARNHEGKFPQYVANAFANLSTSLWVYRYVDDHVNAKIKKKSGKLKYSTDLSEDDIESLKTMISDAFKKSATNQFPGQTQEFKERNKLLSKAFAVLDPLTVHLARKLKLDESQCRELAIQVYGDPTNNFRQIHKINNHSTVSDKKKLKLLKAMYGKKRFVNAVGAAMTVDNNNSDCLAMLYEYFCGLKKKKRAPILLAYARSYKKNKSYNFRLNDGKFYEKNKDLIKELKHCDIGFKKAFKQLKPKKVADKMKEGTGKKVKSDKRAPFTVR